MHVRRSINIAETVSVPLANMARMGSMNDFFVLTPPKDYPRSPLRYPGGKSRAVAKIIPMIPKDTSLLCSPFIGGGSIELACASMGIKVKGYDLFDPLIDFWQCLLNSPARLADRVASYFPLERSRFYELQRGYMDLKNTLEKAAVFYVLNRSSFSGTTLSGGMSPNHPRFTQSAIDRLREFSVEDISFDKGNFSQSIADNEDAFLYLDPPYLNGQKLYGVRGDKHEGFDHQSLKEILDKRDRWILSYNDCSTIRELYSDYQILSAHWKYGISNGKGSSEVIVVSQDLRTA